MPTGYTAKIQAGQTFEDFALGCARAFGACLHQRDGGTDDKPKLREESLYHEEKLPEALAELGYLQSLKDEQIDEYGQQARDEAIASIQKSLVEKDELKAKYVAMLNKVSVWTPPTSEHAGLKDFMTKQIVDSIEFDCNTKHDLERLQTAISRSPTEFYKEAVEKAEWYVDYHEKELAKERERVNSSNDWIIELYKSLGLDYE